MKFNNRNIFVGSNVRLGRNVRIGDNTTIYDNVVIDDDVTICNDCVIGEPLASYYTDKGYVNPTTQVGSGSLIRSHSIIYAGSDIGDGFSCGHRVTIREHCKIGLYCRIGTASDIQNGVVIADYAWMHSNVFIAAKTIVGSYVFMYPGVIVMDDPRPPSDDLLPCEFCDYSQVGAGSMILAGSTIGRHALIGAGSVVTRSVEPYQLAFGNPARMIKDVRSIADAESGASPYPWPHRFERGMPWSGVGFEQWQKNEEDRSSD
jgi:acetyltransferase-like isoleucine patch superfamily enzyme